RPEQAYEFFRVYCRVLMRGSVDFYARWGMAFEPHLQNVYVALRDGVPSRIILRDLDSTILDPVRIRPVARANGVRLAPGTGRHTRYSADRWAARSRNPRAGRGCLKAVTSVARRSGIKGKLLDAEAPAVIAQEWV